jgi:hypothetical protein
MASLEEIRSNSTTTQRLVDNLPIPLIIQLNPENRQIDFINSQAGKNVKRSHILAMRIDKGLLVAAKLNYSNIAYDIAKRLNTDEASPFKDLINFGAVGAAPLQLHVLMSDRKDSLLCSLFGAAKILADAEQTIDWYMQQFVWLYNYVDRETNCMKRGNLLETPFGPKGCATLFLGVLNSWLFYMVANALDEPVTSDVALLKNALALFSFPVNGDLSRKHRQTLMGGFAQNLFREMASDEECNVRCVGGIPVALQVKTSPSCFALDALPKEISKEFSNYAIGSMRLPTDTDPLYEEIPDEEIC